MGKKVSDLIQIDEMRELGDLPVFLGGPVSSDQLTFASINWDAKDEELDLIHIYHQKKLFTDIEKDFLSGHLLAILDGQRDS